MNKEKEAKIKLLIVIVGTIVLLILESIYKEKVWFGCLIALIVGFVFWIGETIISIFTGRR